MSVNNATGNVRKPPDPKPPDRNNNSAQQRSRRPPQPHTDSQFNKQTFSTKQTSLLSMSHTRSRQPPTGNHANTNNTASNNNNTNLTDEDDDDDIMMNMPTTTQGHTTPPPSTAQEALTYAAIAATPPPNTQHNAKPHDLPFTATTSNTPEIAITAPIRNNRKRFRPRQTTHAPPTDQAL